MTEKLSDLIRSGYYTALPNALADEIAVLERQLDRWYELYAAVNEMMCELGKVGEINTRHADVDRVMDVLHDIDGGDYLTREKLQERLNQARNTPSAE